jgi:alpha-L-rhamnosidase
LLGCVALTLTTASAEGTAPDLDGAPWPAHWIAPAGACPSGPGVYHFRKRVTLAAAPASFVVRVSGDNRFVFFVNGTRVGDGPARGDPAHWRFETFEIAPLLHAGENLLAATVWNCGDLAPVAQMSYRTGFIVQGNSEAEAGANSDASWESEIENGQTFEAVKHADLPNYYAAAPSERTDGALYDWEWQTDRSKGAWAPAAILTAGDPARYPGAAPFGIGGAANEWVLVADELPPMEYSDLSVGRIVRVEGVAPMDAFPATLPAHAKASILIDRETMTTAYPDLVVSGGKGASIKVTYAEALVDSSGNKRSRNDIANRTIVGLNDTFVTDGGAGRSWSPFWWREWRYLQLDIQTADEALSIDSLKAHFSAYPFQESASFETNDRSLGRMWQIGIRTARLNSHETYMDCPYWEQLQYIGDTRIQALISYLNFGDDRLARQAIDAYDWSRTQEGLTQSRFPDSLPQFIPTFSLYWIGMIHDYWMYRPDAGRLTEWIVHSRSVLDWYARHLRPDGLLGKMPWWNFADWTHDFERGIPPQDGEGGSAFLSLTYLGALREAADLEAYIGNDALADDYRRRADALATAVRKRCWVDSQQLLADTPSHTHYSEQTNSLGVLFDVVPAEQRSDVMHAIVAHAPGPAFNGLGEFSPASLYFRFYVARALDHAGLADQYLDTLRPWRKMMALNLTTWAEMEEPTRSDDHGWSAHPNYDFLTLVAGIRPASPAFHTVLVAPHLGTLTELRARLPHPAGEIVVHYLKTGNDWTFDINLPTDISGTFVWNGQTTPLAPGPNTLGVTR